MCKSINLFTILFFLFFLFSCEAKKAEEQKEEETTTTTFQNTGEIEKLQDQLDQFLSPGTLPEIIAEGFDWSEGPLWIADKKMLLFSDIPPNSIYSWTEKEGKKLYLKPSGYTGDKDRSGEPGSNGLLLNKDGQLVLCQHGDRRLAIMNAPLEAPAAQFITLTDSYDGKRFNSPNDATYNSKGELFFTDPPYGLEGNMDDPSKELPFQGVYKLGIDGETVLLTDEMTRPNGIALSPDEKTLYVANSDPKKAIWMAFDLTDNGVENGRVLFDATSMVGPERKGLPDGLKVHKSGNLFATGPGGVLILSPTGQHLGTILTGQATSNCAFNDDQSQLFMTADMYVMRIDIL
ncbi:MAG: SMP-30/gluconolactonase/LRE family protein [Saprospiraceae bacterium]|nr:SMP-30/gluconolactonase/LRE family protein [Saprospiraceae bacterium]